MTGYALTPGQIAALHAAKRGALQLHLAVWRSRGDRIHGASVRSLEARGLLIVDGACASLSPAGEQQLAALTGRSKPNSKGL